MKFNDCGRLHHFVVAAVKFDECGRQFHFVVAAVKFDECGRLFHFVVVAVTFDVHSRTAVGRTLNVIYSCCLRKKWASLQYNVQLFGLLPI